MNRKKLQIDIETFSDVDLVNCGVYRYVEGDFHILLFAYAFDDEDVQCVDLACGEQLPQDVVDALHDSSIIKTAWNAQFERTCLSKYLGTQLSPDDWQCTMVWAASLSLPLKLKFAALALKTGEQKDDVGERLIRYFSIPCKPTKSNGGRTRNLPEHAPDDWKLFKSYCIQDVRTERDIRKRLEKFPLLPQEWDYYHMDQRINDRGILIDKELVRQAIIEDMCAVGGIGYKVEFTGKGFIFSLYAGVDRTVGQSENERVIFSEDFENLGQCTYTYDNTDYCNAVMATGATNGTTKVSMYWFNREECVDQKELCYYEAPTDASGLSGSTDGGGLSLDEFNEKLRQLCKIHLAKAKLQDDLNADVFPTSTGHYDLGDRVSIVNRYGITGSATVLEITETEDETGYRTIPTLGNWSVEKE